MEKKNTFDILVLNARPAAGKSEVIDYLKHCSFEDRKKRFKIAEFEEIDDLAKNFEFSGNLIFEAVPGSGFRFGNNPQNMVFVPCYSEQNGYYSSDVDIYYNDKKVLNIDCY